MKLYDLTLKKEVARECAWGVMGTISRIKDKIGETELLKTVQKIKKRVNSGLKVKGILLTMCDNRTNLYKTLTEQVEEMFQGRIKVFQTKIPKTVKVGEAIYSGQSIKKYAKGSSVDVAYDNLAKEICYG